MRDASTHAETLWWLQEQLEELDRWRSELLKNSENHQPSSVDRLDAHREWLKAQLEELEKSKS